MSTAKYLFLAVVCFSLEIGGLLDRAEQMPLVVQQSIFGQISISSETQLLNHNRYHDISLWKESFWNPFVWVCRNPDCKAENFILGEFCSACGWSRFY